jgi:KipI family sensor histidine kinase inhibitor
VTVDFFAIEPLAEDALLLRFGDGMDATANARVHAAAHALRSAKLAGVVDTAPAYATLLLRFDPSIWQDTLTAGELPQEKLSEALRNVLTEAVGPGFGRDGEQKADAPLRIVEVPVCYGGDCGPDLAEVAARARMAPEEVVARHSAGNYTVAMLGFAPGFPYLLGLDPALETPRRADPRTRVPAGSVAIGGAQTGIYPRELPGGWQLIGRTPLVLFDPAREQPCLLAPGDRVRFRAIDGDEFATLAGYP